MPDRVLCFPASPRTILNISRTEQRVLHALAQGGMLRHERGPNGKITGVTCVTRDGLILTDGTLRVALRLRRLRLIRSTEGGPYRITRQGLLCVRSQSDNR